MTRGKSKIVAPELYSRKKPAMYTPERDKFLRDHAGVDPMLLAEEMGVTERFVRQYQRKIGIRPFTGGWVKRGKK